MLMAAPAAAHGDDGLMAVEVNRGGDSLHPLVRARVTYLNDGEPAPGATVSVEPVAADGVAVPATQLADVGGGAYEGTIALPAPGAWTLRLTATTPTATAEESYTATASTTTTRATAATKPETADERSAGANRASGGDGGSGGVVLIIAVAIVALAAGGAVAVLARRRNTSAS